MLNLRCVLLFTFVFIVTPNAIGANHERCKEYANYAVAGYTESKTLACAEKNPVPGRFSQSYDGHYRWCRTVRDSTLDQENNARANVLSHCRRCQSYAGGAVAAMNEYSRLGCGPATNRWSTNFEGHRAWCLNVRKSTQEDEDAKRDRQLNACKVARRPPPPAPPAPTPPRPQPQPPRQCSITALLEVYQCRNLDGSASEYFTTTRLQACGSSQSEAEAIAKASFNGVLGEGAGTCQYKTEFAAGACACTR